MTTVILIIVLIGLAVGALWLWSYTRAIKGIGDAIDTKAIEQREAVKASDIIAKTKQEYANKEAKLNAETKEQVYSRIKLRLIKSDSMPAGNTSTTTSGN